MYLQTPDLHNWKNNYFNVSLFTKMVKVVTSRYSCKNICKTWKFGGFLCCLSFWWKFFCWFSKFFCASVCRTLWFRENVNYNSKNLQKIQKKVEQMYKQTALLNKSSQNFNGKWHFWAIFVRFDAFLLLSKMTAVRCDVGIFSFLSVGFKTMCTVHEYEGPVYRHTTRGGADEFGQYTSRTDAN